MKTKLKKMKGLIQAISILTLLSVVSVAAIAQTSTTNKTPQSNEATCQVGLKEFLDKEITSYTKFMRNHLRNEKSTGDLMVKANQRYMKLRAKLLNKKSSFVLAANIRATSSSLNDIELCKSIVDKYLKTAAAYQKRMIIGNAERKSTIRLAERLRDINNKLNGLNRSVGTVKAYLKVFGQKVPCYVGNCPPL